MPSTKKRRPVMFDVLWPACIQCGACVAVCLQREPFISPFDTIAVDAPCEIACMRCVDVCPTSAVTFRSAPNVSLESV
jgi:ferredoxin